MNLWLASTVVSGVNRLLFGAAVVASALVLAGCSSSSSNGDNPLVVNSPTAAAQSFTGAAFTPAKHLPDVALTDTSGRPWNLAANGRGKVTITYFGYTNCPDACPTDMAAMARAIGSLTPDQQQHVQMVFVTVDPKRDSTTAIRKWLDRFDKPLSHFVGLTGTNAELTNAATKLGLQFKVTSQPAGLEEVEHSSQLTAFNTEGTSNLVWLDPPVPSDIAHDLRLLLGGASPV
jgi:protein SCO1/2